VTDLSGDGVRVLLIATATHSGPTLPSVPAVERSFLGLQTAFLERCGVRSGHLRPVLDPPDAQTMAMAVTEEAQRASTVLLVYFIGHGLLGPGQELYLAASGSDRLVPGMADHQALSFSSLRQALAASRASSVVVVLDCCFSGRPLLGSRSSGPAFALAPAHGLYLMGSAEQLALAPPDAPHTAFTGAVLDLLEHGDPRGPQTLTLDAVYDTVFQKLRDQNRPWPQRQAGDRSGNLVIAPNPATPIETGRREEQEPAPGRCPYPGLDAFGPDDADVFFGREDMTERILTAVATCASSPDTPASLVLVGPSGSGKTSLLNAGLLAGLRNSGLPGLPGSVGWPCVRFSPGASPLRRLAGQLDNAAPDASDQLRENPRHAVELVDTLLVDRPDQRLIMIVDQLEELFTLCEDPAERAAFLQAVTAVAEPVGERPPRGLVVLALRADFYGRAAEHTELLTELRERQLLIAPLTSQELRATIEQPAAAVGLALDDGLADVILHELGATAGGQPATGSLPLLSHALWATWRKRAGSRLTVAGYRATGGIAQAIAATADEVYDKLDKAGQDATRRMLPRLVRVGEDTNTARTLDRSSLLHGLPDIHAAQHAIDRLTEARLLTLDRDTARISHEALLREWPLLREWLDADRDWLRAHQQLDDDTEAWERAERDPSLLYRGNRLAAMNERAAQAPTDAKDLEPGLAEFMDTSRRQERRGSRRRRLAVALLAALALLASVGLAGSIAFQRQATQAQDRDLAQYLATQANALRDSQPGLAKQLSLLSYQINPDAGRGAILDSQHTPGTINAQQPAYDLATSADSRVLAISTGDAIVLHTQHGALAGRISELRIGPIAVTADGQYLAEADAGSHGTVPTTLRLWNIADLDHIRQTVALTVTGGVSSLAVSTDGRTLFAGANTGDIARWDISNPKAPTALASLTTGAAAVDSLEVSPRRDLLASVSGSHVQVWDTTDTSHPVSVATFDDATTPQAPMPDNLLPSHRVAFDRTGQMLAYPGTDPDNQSIPLLWNISDPRAPQRIPDQEPQYPAGDQSVDSIACGAESMTALAFSPDKNQLTAICGSSWYMWLYLTGSTPYAIRLATSQGPVGLANIVGGAILIDPTDADRLLVTSATGVQVWDVSDPSEPGATAVLPSSSPQGTANASLVFGSAGGRELAAVFDGWQNTLWDVSDLSHVRQLLTSQGPPDNGAVALSTNGELFADTEPDNNVAGADVRLRSTSTPNSPPLGTIDNLDNGVEALAFSPTQPILVVADSNNLTAGVHSPPTMRIYNIADPRRPRQVAQLVTNPSNDPSQLLFSPDGKTFLTVDNDTLNGDATSTVTTLHSWDITEPSHPVELWSHAFQSGQELSHIAFRPDGALLAAYGGGGTLRLWHVDHDRLVGQPAAINIGGAITIPELTFSPDGTRVALMAQVNQTNETTTDETVRPEIWDLTNPDQPVQQSYLPGLNDSDFDFTPLAFNPDGTLLGVLRTGAGVDLWDTDPAHIASGLCATVGDPITPQEWNQYLSDRPYQPPCP
jgi:WD40 repeat protein